MTRADDASLLAKLYGDDTNTIPYRPQIARAIGSVTSSILLQQIVYWWNVNDQAPFYKFKEPCKHRLYREGDSWCEETGLSRREFDSALSGIAIKKTHELTIEDAIKAARNPEHPRPVIYWISADRVTYYTVDLDTLLMLLRIAYVLKAESADSKSTKAPFGKGGKRRLVKAESADTISETSNAETTTETSAKETAPSSAGPAPSAAERKLAGLRERLGSDPFSVASACLSAQQDGGGSWTIPAEAGGADPIGEEMLQSWYSAKGTDIRLASEKDKEQFRRALGKLAREMPGISPAQAAQVVRTLLDHNNPEWGWYTYSSPSVEKFKRDWKEVAMRLLSDPGGNGQSPANQTATDGFLRLLEKERAKQAAFPTYQRPAGTSQPAPSQPAPEPHEVAVAAETVTSAIPTPTLRKKPKQWYELLVLPGQEQPTKEAQSNG